MDQNIDYSTDAFVGIPSFLRSDIITDFEQLEKRDFSIGIMGIPFDESCPFMPGSRFCARSIREHSLRFGKEGFYNHKEKRLFLGEELAKNQIVDFGDVNIFPTDIEGSFRRATELAGKILDKKALLLVMGGDHSITYPVVRAFSTPIHVIHLDAHADFMPILPEPLVSNGNPFTLISKLPHVKSITQIGNHSIRDTSILDSIKAGNQVIDIYEFRELGIEGITEYLPKGEPCYVSIDIDVLDSSLIPGCVSAEPNGMTYNELSDTLAAIAKHTRVLGFDMVEVTPNLDVGTGITSYLAAHAMIEFLGFICDQPYWKEK